MTLPAAAARAPAPIGRGAAPAAVEFDICCTRPISAANNLQVAVAVGRWDRQTDGRTDMRTILVAF